MNGKAKPPARKEGGKNVALTKKELIRREGEKVFSAPLAERGELLADSDYVDALVPNILPEDFLFLIRASTIETVAALLPHAKASQVGFLLDVEIWRGEEVDPKRAAIWLSLVNSMGEKPLVRLLKYLPPAEIGALLGRVAKAGLNDEDGLAPDDEGEDETSFTLDGVHYFRTTEALAPALKRVMMLLRGEDYSKYNLILELILTEFDAEDEETAAHFRRVRLAERGFLDFEEAQRIYKPIDVEGLKSLPGRAEARPLLEGQGGPHEYLALEAVGGWDLKRVMDRLSGTAEGVELAELVGRLVNNVVAADALDMAEQASFKKAALKVYSYLSLGLDAFVGGDPAKMEAALVAHFPESIFRLGWSVVKNLRAEARGFLSKGWPGGKKELLTLLPRRTAKVLLALDLPRPMLYRGGKQGEPLSDFSSLREIEAARREIKKAELIGEFTKERLGLLPGQLLGMERDAAFIEAFLTSLANAFLGREFVYQPIDRKDAPAALARFWEVDAPPRKLAPALHGEALKWALSGLTGLSGGEELLGEFIAEALDELKDNFGLLPVGSLPDPRYLSGLWIE